MEKLNRRTFMKSVAAVAAVSAVPTAKAEAQGTGPVFLSTWAWGKSANERAAEVFKAGGSLLDAVEKGINVPESDPNVPTVGYGGLPNADGVVSLDAGIMDGTRHRAGSVCALEGIKNPISVARLVLEKTRHTTMAGEGALRFALKFGFKTEQLLTPQSLERWMKWKATPDHETFWITPDNHDTIGMVASDGRGHVVAGCSTSGLQWKIPGRVADSPLVGLGYFADDNAGAASATGDGDLMSNYCTSITIVHMMARGATPEEACAEVLRNMVKTLPANKDGECAVIAMNNRGEIGTASMNSKFHLKYALWRNGQSQLLDSIVLY
jgi:N4-(beta-N-acetylglucosaminyl)-L-asparaginase